MGFLLVLKAELTRSLIIMKRYWFATVIGIIVGYGMLAALIYGFLYNRDMLEAAMRERVTQNALGWVLGFVVGTFAMGIVSLFTTSIQGMARTGELEQVCMSPHGLVANFLARSIVSATTSVMSATIMLTLIALTVKTQFHADPFPTVVLLVLTFANLIGFGFMVGGLAIVFKQTGQIARILQLILLGVAIGSTWAVNAAWPLNWIAHALPITDAAVTLKLVVVEGAGTAVFAHPSFYLLILNCLLWGAIGIACFRYMENWSRDKGTLGAY